MHEPERDATVDFGFDTISEGEKTARVKRVFDAVASRYDLMNDLMSAGVHRLWKESLVLQLAPRPGQTILDLAGGTGDIARRIRRRSARLGAPARIVVCDINEAMLRAGRGAGETHRDAYATVCADAEHLPFADRSLDGATIGFGIRNVTHRAAALAEIRRVLRVGGRFMCLEFSRPVVPLLETLYDRYSFDVIPRLGAFIANDEASYRYLVESIRRFPPQTEFDAEVRAAGFKKVSHRNLSGGIVAIHSGWAY